MFHLDRVRLDSFVLGWTLGGDLDSALPDVCDWPVGIVTERGDDILEKLAFIAHHFMSNLTFDHTFP